MQIFADLQIHSRYSRAVSKAMTLPFLSAWAKKKGLGLIATGDWTHPLWFREIERDLEESGNGFLKLKKAAPGDPDLLLATEISSIFTQGGKGRRVHTLVWVPTIDSARKISAEMTRRGCNLLSDGRPITKLSCMAIAEIALTVDPKALVIPAHAWTPWFSLYGSMSGFDSLDEAFGPYAKFIPAVETGLSSSPEMNWRIKELDNRNILSFSDAHSGSKLGREATVFETDGTAPFSYDLLYDAVVNKPHPTDHTPPSKIAFTIEFFPEEGKYHFSGHRACSVRAAPATSEAKSAICPVCGKPLTQGVVQRVDQLAGRSEADLQLEVVKTKLPGSRAEITMTRSRAFPGRPPFTMTVPLAEIIAESFQIGAGSKKVALVYDKLTEAFGGEFAVLLNTSQEEISRIGGEKVGEGIEKMRRRDIVVDPGYDGVFGVVRIWKRDDAGHLVDPSREQMKIF